MYITLKNIKRNWGFKGIEVTDILIALPIITLFIILFCFTKFKMICIDDMPFHYLIDKPCGGCNHGNRKKK